MDKREIQELSDNELECLYYNIKREMEERERITNKKISSFEGFFEKVAQNIELKYRYEKNSRKNEDSKITESLFNQIKNIFEKGQIVEFKGVYYKISVKREYKKGEEYFVYAEKMKYPIIKIS